MAKLYFKYGAMGSSKTAQALITKQRGAKLYARPATQSVKNLDTPKYLRKE